MPPISAVICCANVQDTLEQACESVRWADELVIVDSGSDDGTAEIARRHADRYVLEPWRGYVGQKSFGCDQATHDWIFLLDGDEECTPQLADEWRRLSDAELERLDVLLVRRANYVMRRRVRSWWPDHSTRIFHRRRSTWPEEALHDIRLPSAPTRARKLKCCIVHKRHSAAGFVDYFGGRRLEARLPTIAAMMHERGRRCHWWDMLLRPWAAFWKSYLIKRGFLDGTFGLLIAQKMAVSTQLKYAALWALQEEKKAQEKR